MTGLHRRTGIASIVYSRYTALTFEFHPPPRLQEQLDAIANVYKASNMITQVGA